MFNRLMDTRAKIGAVMKSIHDNTLKPYREELTIYGDDRFTHRGININSPASKLIEIASGYHCMKLTIADIKKIIAFAHYCQNDYMLQKNIGGYLICGGRSIPVSTLHSKSYSSGLSGFHRCPQCNKVHREDVISGYAYMGWRMTQETGSSIIAEQNRILKSVATINLLNQKIDDLSNFQIYMDKMIAEARQYVIDHPLLANTLKVNNSILTFYLKPTRIENVSSGVKRIMFGPVCINIDIAQYTFNFYNHLNTNLSYHPHSFGSGMCMGGKGTFIDMIKKGELIKMIQYATEALIVMDSGLSGCHYSMLKERFPFFALAQPQKDVIILSSQGQRYTYPEYKEQFGNKVEARQWVSTDCCRSMCRKKDLTLTDETLIRMPNPDLTKEKSYMFENMARKIKSQAINRADYYHLFKDYDMKYPYDDSKLPPPPAKEETPDTKVL